MRAPGLLSVGIGLSPSSMLGGSISLPPIRCRAGALYQKTEAGWLNHKVRQELYRIRVAEKVTHHGDPATMVGLGHRRRRGRFGGSR